MNQEPARGSLRLLVDPVFGPYFFGRLLSTAGIWIHNIVAAILAFQLTGSAFIVGLVSVAQFAPQLLFAPLSGALADRGDRRRQIVLGRVVAACGSGGLALWLAIYGADEAPYAWPVILAALTVGTDSDKSRRVVAGQVGERHEDPDVVHAQVPPNLAVPTPRRHPLTTLPPTTAWIRG